MVDEIPLFHRRNSLSLNPPETVDNPVPQVPPGGSRTTDNPVLLDVAGLGVSTWSTASDKIVLIMVGLPARGKTYVARRVARYLEFFHAANIRQFNIGDYRRRMYGNFHDAAWFSPTNAEAVQARKRCADAALNDLTAWMGEANDARIGILDGTHSTMAKRQYALARIRPLKCKIIFIESICSSDELIERNIRSCKLGTPDYNEMAADAAIADFRSRIAVYESNYETIDAASTEGAEASLSWIKVVNSKRFIINHIRGYMASKIVQFLSNLHMDPHLFYFTRHGQSEYNVLGKIGGDSGLSPEGLAYARALATFVETEVVVDAAGHFGPAGRVVCARLWTSTMRRTRETAQFIAHPVLENYFQDGDGYEYDDDEAHSWVQMRPRAWHNLDEIFAGICDGMSYEDIEAHYPEEFERRQRDKLAYRYPRGESYLDVIHRLDTMIHEMERHREPLVIVAHQGILRLLYAYYMGLPRERAPYVSIPLNTVIKLTPGVFECHEERFVLYKMPEANDGQNEPPTTDNDDDPTVTDHHQPRIIPIRSASSHDIHDPPSH